MKQFTAILCLTFVALTAAEVGYNYPSPAAPAAPLLSSYNAPAVQGNFGHLQQGSAAPLSFPVSQYGSPQAPAQQQQNRGSAYGQTVLFNQQQNNYQQQFQQEQLQPQQQYQQAFAPQRQQIVTKDIYIHSAPEEQEESLLGDDYVSNAPIRKNYRIVFIKAPSHNLKVAANALRQAQTANEEKTVIYVLSKKPDLSEVQAQLQQVQGEQKTSKPEVYFIKYKTQEEAARAQQEIQAQYDSLGGSTHVSDEGIAPITSVSNLSGGLQSGGGGLHSAGILSGGGGGAIPISQYARTAQQSYSQQAYSSSSGGVGASSAGVVGPSNGYLPAKAKK